MIPTNPYGNVDLTHGDVPKGCVHVPGQRLSVTCKSIGIECAPAVTGWSKNRYGYSPVTDGVVIHAKDKAKLLAAIAKRDKNRLSPASRLALRAKRQKRDTADFSELIRQRYPSMPESDVMACAEHATEIGSGRVGRTSDDVDTVRCAVVAYARHNYTDYDSLLSRYRSSGSDGRDQAREEVSDDIRKKVAEWETPKPSVAECIVSSLISQ
jgi:hypothetical protein